MSVIWFPDFPGLTWAWVRTPKWESLLVQTAASQFEARQQQQSYPRWEWSLNFNYLHVLGYPSSALAGFYETMLGFMNSNYGGLTSFAFRDRYDNSVTAQPIGTGDGTTTAFQLQRTYGGFPEPVYFVDTRATANYGPYKRPAALTPVAYVSGTPASATFNDETGVVTFSSAPGSGDPITATFSYGWRVRFEDDSLDLEALYYQIFKLGKLKLLQTNT